MTPYNKQIEHIISVFTILIIALATISFLTAPQLSLPYENRFLYSGVILGITAIVLRFTLNEVLPLHRATYRIATVMALWAAGFYFFPFPEIALYIVGLPGFYFLFRIELKRHKAQLEDKIAAGLLFGLAVLLYTQQQPLQILLFNNLSFNWQDYYSNAPILALCGLGIMRLHRHVQWPALCLLGSLILVAGIGLSFSPLLPQQWPYLAEFITIFCAIHLFLALIFIENPFTSLLCWLSGLSATEFRSYQKWMFSLLNILLQACLVYVYLRHMHDYWAMPYLFASILGLVYFWRRHTINIMFLESSLLIMPAIFLAIPTTIHYLILPMATLLIGFVLLRRFKADEYKLPNISFIFIALSYAYLLVQYDFLSPLGLIYMAIPFLCWIALPGRPANIGRRFHAYLIPVINAAVVLSLFSSQLTLQAIAPLLPIWNIANLLLPILILALINNARFQQFALYRQWYFIKDWQQHGPQSLLVLVLFTLVMSVFSFYLNIQYFALHWLGVWQTLVALGLSLGIFLYMTVRSNNTRWAILSEIVIWCGLGLVRWKMEMLGIMHLGTPADGYILLGAACIVAGLKEVLRRHTSAYENYFRINIILYAIAAWIYLLYTQVNIANHIHNEFSSLLLAGMFYWLSKTAGRHHIILTFIFSNAGVLLYFYRSGLDNSMFYILPTLACVLMLAQLFKDQLSDAQLKQIRLYCSMVMLGTTAFYSIIDFNESIWYPIISALVAAVAVVIGISLQIRIYLYLGCAFFFVNIFGSIVHVIVQQPPENTKLIIGIVFFVTGVLFTSSFLLFQMKREQFLTKYHKIRESINSWD